MDLPFVSIITPTLNSAATLGECLESIAFQDYPGEKLEIIIAEGGSADATPEIIGRFSAELKIKLVPNLLKTGESGKAEGLKVARGEIIALIDSDNILPDKSWLRRMAAPFADARIIACEPLYYTHRASDGYISRYCALLGMNDPLCLFLGNYDRYCWLTKRWTEVPVQVIERGEYLEVGFPSGIIPTIGANGFFIRRKELLRYPLTDYLFDIDVLQFLLEKNPELKIAKIKTGIIHKFSGNIFGFASKQGRRFRDYTYYRDRGLRKFRWEQAGGLKLARFAVYTLLGLTIFQAAKGYLRKRDSAWFFHPLACLLTLCVYGYLSLRNLIFPLQPKKR
ncbi:MAG: glycosyltransferase family 2 protein [Candidatus Omnitrophota bacterium]|nr:glycosyltransferase family 2 protein [Candidatus Omnitrophota bacterium]